MIEIRISPEYEEVTPEYTIITMEGCPPCGEAKKLLIAKGVDFVEKRKEDLTAEEKETLKDVGYGSYPQIFIGGFESASKETLIGGYAELLEIYPHIIKTKINNIMNNDKAYAQEFLDSPISSALLDTPVSKKINDAQSGVGGAFYGILGSSGGFVLGGLPGMIAGGSASAALGAIIEKNTKNSSEFKGVGLGMKQGGILGAAVSTGVYLGASNILATVGIAIGTVLTLNVLFYYLTGKKAEAKKILADKLGDEQANEVIIEIQTIGEDELKKEKDKLEKKVEAAGGDTLKKQIAETAEKMVDKVSGGGPTDAKKVIRV